VPVRNDAAVPVPQAGVVCGLRVVQWNADCVLTKLQELEGWLLENKIDVCMIQESKLRAEDGALRVRGYGCVRRDRNRLLNGAMGRGGGLVTLVRDDWKTVEQPVSIPRTDPLEVLWVDVVDASGNVVHCVNVYAPPESGVHVNLSLLECLPDMREGAWIVCGDFNAHARDWDPYAESDERGTMLLEWADGAGLHVLNDGTATRRERGTHRMSAPDVSLVSDCVLDGCGWRVHEGFTSDHLPIVIELHGESDQRENDMRRMWDWKNADWLGYGAFLNDVAGQYDWDRLCLDECLKLLRHNILRAAKKFVGRKKVQVRYTGHGREVREAILRRDELRASGAEWDEVKQADEEVSLRLREVKIRQWEMLLRKGASHTDMWNVVKGMSRRLNEVGGRNDAVVHEGRCLVSDRQKGNALCRMYAEVSKCRVQREDCLKRRLNARLRAREMDAQREREMYEDGMDVSYEECLEALREMDGSKAAGPDGLYPRMLKHLPVSMIRVVWSMFRRSFADRWVPQDWRVGEIVPLLKSGKSGSDLGSYRPVCLTSCLGKWLERVIANRLRWVLEKSGCFSECQAGFRQGRGVDDQLVRLSQDVYDGFQAREKSGLMLFDMSRAYDRVWRDGLLWKLSETPVSVRMIRWLQVWLCNRLACVRVNDCRSKWRLFEQGLPQGSVLSPLLFLVYVNDLVVSLSERVSVSAFADDLAVWMRSRNVAECSAGLQWAADQVAAWCGRWYMKLAVDKCSVSLFSMNVKDASMEELRVVLNGCEVARELYPKFLGVVFDGRLCFRMHADRCAKKAGDRLRLLRKLAGSSWGWGKDLMRCTYVALVRSVLLFGVNAWGPWLSESGWECLERVQLQAGRIICGMLRSSPCESVLAESGLVPLRELADVSVVLDLDKCRRVAAENLRAEWGLRQGRLRLKREGWRGRALRLESVLLLPEMRRDPVRLSVAPWACWESVAWRIEGRKNESAEVNFVMGMNRLSDCGVPDLWVFSDGSVRMEDRRGGSGVVVCVGEVHALEVIETVAVSGGLLASSFQAELHALECALGWLCEFDGDWWSVVIASDSQSALQRLRGSRGDLQEEVLVVCAERLSELCMRGKYVSFVWVPGHSGIAGNEWADAAAACGVQCDVAGASCMRKGVLARVREGMKRRTWKHERCEAVYGAGLRERVERDWCREDVVSMARLRSGHSLDLGGYRLRVGLPGNGLCRMCGECLETVEHVWECDAGSMMRRMLGLNDVVREMAANSQAAISYWRWWRRRPPR
jgi:ribonuclease HI